MNSLGKYLLDKGVLTPTQLEEATQGLVVFGGRLGTHIVELGYLTLPELEQHLADQAGVPLPPAAWLEQPDPEAIRRVGIEVVKRYGVLPIRSDGDTLHVLMLDPNHPRHLDDLRAATGAQIVPYVVSETRLVALLQQHLRIGGGAAALARRSNKSSDVEVGAVGTTPDDVAPARRGEPGDEQERAARERDALGIVELDGDQELIDEGTFSSLYEEWTPAGAGKSRQADRTDAGRGAMAPADAAAAPAANRPQTEIVLDAVVADRRSEPRRAADAVLSGPREIARLEGELLAADDRESVNAVVLQLARAYASMAALFVVRGDVVMGEQAVGDGVPNSIRALLLPTAVDSMLTVPLETGHPLRGGPRAAIDARVLAALQRSETCEVCVFPVSIRGRAVSLLCADNGDLPIGATAFAALEAVSTAMSRAYERLILARKKSYC